MNFIIQPSRSAWLLVNGTSGFGQEAQNLLVVVSQTLGKVMPDATLWATGTGGAVLLQLLRQGALQS